MKAALTGSEYEAIVEQAPVLIWRAGADAERDYFNDPWLAFRGKTLEQESGFGWVEGIHCDDLDYCIEECLRAYSLRRVFEIEYRLRRYDGEYRWMHDRSVPLHGNAGAFLGFIGSSTDVTDMLASRDKAYRNLDMLGGGLEKQPEHRPQSTGASLGETMVTFSDMLTVIMGAGTLLQKKLCHDGELQQIVEQILLSSERAAGLIRVMTAFDGAVGTLGSLQNRVVNKDAPGPLD